MHRRRQAGERALDGRARRRRSEFARNPDAADQEIARARRELRTRPRLATSIAAEILRQGMTPDDDRRLVGEFVEQIGRRA
jgi:hypothetical protein